MVEPITGGVLAKAVTGALGGALKVVFPAAWTRFRERGQSRIPDRKTLLELLDFVSSAIDAECRDIGAVDPTLTEFLGSKECVTFVEHYLVFALTGRPTEFGGALGREFSTMVSVYGSPAATEVEALYRLIGGTVALVIDSLGQDVTKELAHSQRSRASEIVQSVYLQSIDAQLASLSSHTAAPTRGELRRFHDAYCRVAVSHFGTIQPPNFDGAAKVDIDDLYVAPRIVVSDRLTSAKTQIPIGGLIEYRRLVVLGDPGGGKTTLTRKLAYDMASDALASLGSGSDPGGSVVPLVVVLREFAQFLERTPGSVVDYLEKSLRATFQVEVGRRTIEWMLSTGRVYLVFDGLDELTDTSSRQEVASIVDSFASLYRSVPVLVTSRRVGYMQAPLHGGTFSIAELGELTEPNVKEYVTKWFSAAATLTDDQRTQLIEAFMSESKVVEDLRTNPLMLALMCTIYRAESYIPRNRPDVYEKCARMLFDRWDRHRGLLQPFEFEAHIEPALMRIAYWLYAERSDQEHATQIEIERQATEYLQAHQYEDKATAERAARSFVEFCRGRAWVFSDVGLSSADEPLYQFTHRTFLEFFAAAHLARTSASVREALRKLLPRIRRVEWDVVSQLAIQIKAKAVDGGADEALTILLNEAGRSKLGPKKRQALLSFAGRCMSFLTPGPSVTRRCANVLLREVLTADGSIIESLSCTSLLDMATSSSRETRRLFVATIAESLLAGMRLDAPGLELRTSLAFQLARGGQSIDIHEYPEVQRLADKAETLMQLRCDEWSWAAVALWIRSGATVEETVARLDILSAFSTPRVPGFNFSYVSPGDAALTNLLRRWDGAGDRFGLDVELLSRLAEKAYRQVPIQLGSQNSAGPLLLDSGYAASRAADPVESGEDWTFDSDEVGAIAISLIILIDSSGLSLADVEYELHRMLERSDLGRLLTPLFRSRSGGDVLKEEHIGRFGIYGSLLEGWSRRRVEITRR